MIEVFARSNCQSKDAARYTLRLTGSAPWLASGSSSGWPDLGYDRKMDLTHYEAQRMSEKVAKLSLLVRKPQPDQCS